jgi:16S rRNA (guanine(966)-N(2))-methyltransferase RsmD
MRIISGKFKSRRITAPKHLPVRPTTDRAKEALFNIINNEYYFEGLKVLDLFAGIGSISFEFASRGVEDITAVDQNKGCIEFIRETADSFEIDIQTYCGNVIDFLNKTTYQFDIIFADPPYDLSDEAFGEIIDIIFEENLLTEKGIFILEHSKHTDLSAHPKFQRSRTYGHSVFSRFE